jgi:hypothetical protein
VIEPVMPHRIQHPTKEQVRAYMAERERARKPPPPPDEIRRQLGWHIAPPDEQFSLVQFYLIPTNCGQALSQVVINWWLGRVRRLIPAGRT